VPKEYVETFFSGRSDTTVLFVDDQKNARLIGLHLLRQLGFNRVLLASDGEEALRLYQLHSSEILLVLSDLQMPNMNGEELFWQLKLANDSLRMILCSAMDLGERQNRERLNRMKAKGLRSFVAKPFSSDEFDMAVVNALM